MLFFFFKSKQLHTHMSFIKYYPFNESWIHSNWQEDYQQDSNLDASEYKPGALVFLKEEFFFICKMDSVEHPQCIQYQG